MRNAHGVPTFVGVSRESFRPGKLLPKQLATGDLLTNRKICEKARLEMSAGYGCVSSLLGSCLQRPSASERGFENRPALKLKRRPIFKPSLPTSRRLRQAGRDGAAGGDARATMWDGRPRPSDCRKRLGKLAKAQGNDTAAGPFSSQPFGPRPVGCFFVPRLRRGCGARSSRPAPVSRWRNGDRSGAIQNWCGMLVATASPARTALKNSQLTPRPRGERHAYLGDRTLGRVCKSSM